MEASELKHFYPFIVRDFASGEYPPQDILHMHMKAGRQAGFVLCDGSIDVAYAFCAASAAHDYVLLSLFAVFPELRGQGIGAAFLLELQKIYALKQAIMVEVERPEEARTAEEQGHRLRRIAFYERAGYHLIRGIDYTIWDVPMHLMVLPINASLEMIKQEVEEIMYQIYLELAGERFINKVQFKQ
ncbi:MAG: GNAT family N-acetyltransferase [Methanobacterium sp.]